MPIPRHILVVEDNACLRGLFVDVLSSERDLLVDAAATIAEAEALLGSPDAAYDAILLDLGLPDGDGRDLCRQLRQRGLQIPILLLTGSAGEQGRLEGLSCGASDYLIKPVRIADLLVRLRAQLPAFDAAAAATLPTTARHIANARP
ncbi:response regulator transcription factor [Falsiroseomonas sp. E2-1-a20]|uniref:response regulator transcription factor n=1 Tax=Falsiroseomonas sp. E2-1-a20 TaxID=3239300 RepID=UPI003F4147E7